MHPDRLTIADAIVGGSGFNELRFQSFGNTLDLSGLSIEGLQSLPYVSANVTLKVDQDALDGVTQIAGTTGARLETEEAALDLTGLNSIASSLAIVSKNATGTDYMVSTATHALFIRSESGLDSVTLTSGVFTDAQKSELFAYGIRSVVDETGTYESPFGEEAEADAEELSFFIDDSEPLMVDLGLAEEVGEEADGERGEERGDERGDERGREETKRTGLTSLPIVVARLGSHDPNQRMTCRASGAAGSLSRLKPGGAASPGRGKAEASAPTAAGAPSAPAPSR